MFYEGAEKRLAICTSNTDLFTYKSSFWTELVEQAGAVILSQIENKMVKAFLLSESSLFVWRDQILLITCGETELIKSAQFFLQHISLNHIESVLFQRHPLIRPTSQKSHFIDDCKLLINLLQGKGEVKNCLEYQGDLFIYHRNQCSSHKLKTKQLLMFNQISGEFSSQLQQGTVDKIVVYDQLKIAEYLPDFKIDHFSFDPKGYSINGICDQNYFTVHITPEKLTAYVSFESSLPKDKIVPFITHLLCLFKPKNHILQTF